MVKTIIFTDLDGTLLHPKTYSFDAAQPALKLIKEKGIPLVLCSSKTRSEIEVYREKLKNEHPFISENGGGIFIPEGYFPEAPSPQPPACATVDRSPTRGEGGGDLIIPPPLTGGGKREGEKYTVITLGKPHAEIRKVFIAIQEKLGINAKGFGDMSAKETAALAGLTLTEAELAKQREFDEPFIFGEGETRVQEFLKVVEDAGLRWTQGRFYHILGDNDKGKAVRILKQFYEKAYGRIKTIGLGDKFNDLPMLQEADYPVLVQDENGSYDTRVNLPNLIKADGIGPEGWNKAVIKLPI